MDVSESKRPSKATLNGHDAGDVGRVAGSHQKNRRTRKKQSAKLDSSDGRRSGKPIDIKQEGLSKQEALMRVANRAEAWRSEEGEAYATIDVKGHYEHHEIGSAAFRDWLLIEGAHQFQVGGVLRGSVSKWSKKFWPLLQRKRASVRLFGLLDCARTGQGGDLR